ncbi:unnamed protein product, partial [Cyprideis torosa]
MASASVDLNHYFQQGYRLVPLSRTVLVDHDTPVSAYRKLAGGAWSYLLESVQGGEQWGRYSIIGLETRTRYIVRGHELTIERADAAPETTTVDDPLAEIDRIHAALKVAPVDGLPRMTGGLVGYFGYEIIRYIEARLDLPEKADPIGAPDIVLMHSTELVVFDNLSGRLHLIVHVDPADPNALDKGEARLDELALKLRQPLTPPVSDGSGQTLTPEDFQSHFAKDDYFAAVERAKQYVYDGDIFQVVPSRRVSAPFSADSFDLYRALRTTNPSPYLIYFDFDDFQVVASSPEILFRVEDEMVTVRPIAGT